VARIVLVLSPHLDDAVLSCPVYLQRLVRDGVEVRVVTVFTQGEPLHRTRRAEDRRALAELGGAATHLGFLDAPFRSPQYSGFCGIVFGRAREYPSTVRLVAERIARLTARWQPVSVIAPLAVGNHVDHRVVRDAALAGVPPGQLLFYEDRPYAFIRAQVRHALGLRQTGGWTRYFAATYVRRYRGTASDVEISRNWKSVPPFPLRLRKAFTWTASARELGRALAAIRC
jgi:LmbE family N-acetylglucosaminyl deacetylase